MRDGRLRKASERRHAGSRVLKKAYNFYRDVKRARIGWNKGRRTEVEPNGFLKKFAIWEAGETRLGSN